MLSDNPSQRLAQLKSEAQTSLDANQAKVDAAKSQLEAQKAMLTQLPNEQQLAAQESIKPKLKLLRVKSNSTRLKLILML